MAQFMLSVWGPTMTEEEAKTYMASGAFEATGKLNEELEAEGKLVFAGGLEQFTNANTVRYDAGSIVGVTDGPYAEIKENLGGFWILELRDRDEAMEIAKRAAVACQGSVEVRPFQTGPPA